MTQRNDKRRWWLPAAILTVGGGLLYLLQVSKFTITSRPSADLNYILWAMMGSVFVWIMAGSGLQPVKRMQAVLILFAIQALGALIFRINGYERLCCFSRVLT